MSSHDVKCRICGEITGVNYDVCQDCADKVEPISPKSSEPVETDDIPF